MKCVIEEFYAKAKIPTALLGSKIEKLRSNKDISEDRKERMRQALAKAKSELHQQEFDF